VLQFLAVSDRVSGGVVKSFANALRGHLGKDVFVFLSIKDSTGRIGRVIEVGEDYVEIASNNQTYYIPFTAILAVTPKDDVPPT
jgi:hypothetical protein